MLQGRGIGCKDWYLNEIKKQFCSEKNKLIDFKFDKWFITLPIHSGFTYYVAMTVKN